MYERNEPNQNPTNAASAPVTTAAPTVPQPSLASTSQSTTSASSANRTTNLQAASSGMDSKEDSEISELLNQKKKEIAKRIEDFEKELQGGPKIFIAALQGDINSLKIDLEGPKGAEIFNTPGTTVSSDKDFYIITVATTANKLAAVQYLLGVNTKLNPGNKINKTIISAYLNAAAMGYTEIVQEFLNYGVPVDVTFESIGLEGKKTALMFACWSGHEKVVRLLVSHNADILASDEIGNHSLNYAVDGGDAATFTIILDKLETLRNTDLRPIKIDVLSNVRQRDRPHLLQLFIKREKQKIFTEFNAIIGVDNSIFKDQSKFFTIYLNALKTYFKPSERKLYLAKIYFRLILKGDVALMQHFLSEMGREVEINAYTDLKLDPALELHTFPGEQLSALTIAALKGHQDMVEYLIKQHANVNQVSMPKFFITPLIGAMLGGSYKNQEEKMISIMSILLNNGAKIVKEDSSSAHMAFKLNSEAAIKFLYLWKIAQVLQKNKTESSNQSQSHASGQRVQTTLDKKSLDELKMMPPIRYLIDFLYHTKADILSDGSLYAMFEHQFDLGESVASTVSEGILINDRDILALIARLHQTRCDTMKSSERLLLICELLRKRHIECGSKSAVTAKQTIDSFKTLERTIAVFSQVQAQFRQAPPDTSSSADTAPPLVAFQQFIQKLAVCKFSPKSMTILQPGQCKDSEADKNGKKPDDDNNDDQSNKADSKKHSTASPAKK